MAASSTVIVAVGPNAPPANDEAIVMTCMAITRPKLGPSLSIAAVLIHIAAPTAAGQPPEVAGTAQITIAACIASAETAPRQLKSSQKYPVGSVYRSGLFFT